MIGSKAFVKELPESCFEKLPGVFIGKTTFQKPGGMEQSIKIIEKDSLNSLNTPDSTLVFH